MISLIVMVVVVLWLATIWVAGKRLAILRSMLYGMRACIRYHVRRARMSEIGNEIYSHCLDQWDMDDPGDDFCLPGIEAPEWVYVEVIHPTWLDAIQPLPEEVQPDPVYRVRHCNRCHGSARPKYAQTHRRDKASLRMHRTGK